MKFVNNDSGDERCAHTRVCERTDNTVHIQIECDDTSWDLVLEDADEVSDLQYGIEKALDRIFARIDLLNQTVDMIAERVVMNNPAGPVSEDAIAHEIDDMKWLMDTINRDKEIVLHNAIAKDVKEMCRKKEKEE